MFHPVDRTCSLNVLLRDISYFVSTLTQKVTSLYPWYLMHSLHITAIVFALKASFLLLTSFISSQQGIFSGPNGADNPSCMIIRQSRLFFATFRQLSVNTLSPSTSWVQNLLAQCPRPHSAPTSLHYFLFLVLSCSRFLLVFLYKKESEREIFVLVAAVGRDAIPPLTNGTTLLDTRSLPGIGGCFLIKQSNQLF